MEGIVDAPGARLFYRCRGAGPVLLLLPGGDGDADACEELVRQLESDFTVVSYDRRGLSRSTSMGAPPDLSVHADDAALILSAITNTPAFVFGTSIGALIAIELRLRHPERVRLAVSHEPPIGALLSDGPRDELAEAQHEVEEIHRRDGLSAAMARFAQLAGLDFTDREDGIRLAPPNAARLANLEFFLTYDAPAVRRYQPDLAALRAAAGTIAPAVGINSTGLVPQACLALARFLNREVVRFPGGHNGPVLRPRACAVRLTDVLRHQDAGTEGPRRAS